MATIKARKQVNGSTRYTAVVRIRRRTTVLHQESRTFTHRAAALSWAKHREVALEEPAALTRQRHGTPTLAELIRWYINTFETVSRWQRSKQTHLEFLERHSLGKIEVLTLTSADLIRHVRSLPRSLRRSVTWDRGKEMSQHAQFSVATNVKVYFCDPQSPWQRGTNENTNGLLRQYFPKGTDLSGYTQSQLDRIALRLNQRPRETLGFDTPANTLRARVAPTG